VLVSWQYFSIWWLITVFTEMVVLCYYYFNLGPGCLEYLPKTENVRGTILFFGLNLCFYFCVCYYFRKYGIHTAQLTAPLPDCRK
jgi:hypothetical protein